MFGGKKEFCWVCGIVETLPPVKLSTEQAVDGGAMMMLSSVVTVGLDNVRNNLCARHAAGLKACEDDPPPNTDEVKRLLAAREGAKAN